MYFLSDPISLWLKLCRVLNPISDGDFQPTPVRHGVMAASTDGEPGIPEPPAGFRQPSSTQTLMRSAFQTRIRGSFCSVIFRGLLAWYVWLFSGLSSAGTRLNSVMFRAWFMPILAKRESNRGFRKITVSLFGKTVSVGCSERGIRA